MDCIQIKEKKNKKRVSKIKRVSNRKRKKKSYPHQKRVSNRKKKKPSAQEKRKQTILKYLDFFPSLFKRPVCRRRRRRAPEHCRRRWSSVVSLSRASSAGLLPLRSRTSSAVVMCVTGARAIVRRTGDCCWSRR